MRVAFAKWAEVRLERRCRTVSVDELRRRAVVIAPHYDDETLGCGATLALKARHGAQVHVLFLTDGAASHAAHLDRQQLRELRRSEAVSAVRALGLDDSSIGFGELPDGALTEHEDEAVELIANYVSEHRPSEVYVPHRGDGHADHTAATAAAMRAIAGVLGPVDVYEYPVWHWQQWPWVGLAPLWQRRRWGAAELHGDAWRRSARSWFGLRFSSSLNAVVDVEQTRAQKCAAAERYVTQMAVPEGVDGWPTLHDVSFGHFVERLLNRREFFRVTRAAGAQSSPVRPSTGERSE